MREKGENKYGNFTFFCALKISTLLYNFTFTESN